jgi:hypothetical protein
MRVILEVRGGELRREDTKMALARNTDPTIQALYVARRKAATATDGSGFKAMRGWAELERVENELRAVDPDGDWTREHRGPDTNWKWTTA